MITDFQSKTMYVLGKHELQIKNMGDILVSNYVFDFIAENWLSDCLENFKRKYNRKCG